jgi:hypothetical protein
LRWLAVNLNASAEHGYSNALHPVFRLRYRPDVSTAEQPHRPSSRPNARPDVTPENERIVRERLKTFD